MSDMQELVFWLPNRVGKHEEQGLAYIALPPSAEAGGKYPLLLAFHGSGRGALSYRDIPFYRRQRDIAVSCGYIFAVVSNGPDTFGKDDGLENIENLYTWIGQNYPVSEQVVLWATSAGGLLMHRFFRLSPERVSLLLGIFPIFDPLEMPQLPSMMRAFGATDRDSLLRKVYALGIVPSAFPKGLYRKKYLVIAHGREDKAVPIAQSHELMKQVERDGGEMTLVEKPGGHSTQNMSLYETSAFCKALLGQKKADSIKDS